MSNEWKKPPKLTASELVEQRTKELEDKGRAVYLSGRQDRRVGGTPRSVIFTKKMTIPKGKRGL